MASVLRIKEMLFELSYLLNKTSRFIYAGFKAYF